MHENYRCIFPLSFQPEGHWTSFVFLLLEMADRDFSHRNQSHPCRVLFPMIAWKCSKLLHKKQSAPQKTNDGLHGFSVSVFYFSILYVKAHFSVPLISTLPSLPIFLMFVFNTYSKNILWKITTQVSKCILQRVISR